MKGVLIILLNLTNLHQFNAKMEHKIVGGEITNIEKYPHSVYLELNCGAQIDVCGSSILNQQILLTAGHCLECHVVRMSVTVSYGSKSRHGISVSGERWMIHKLYDEQELNNDVGLVKLVEKLNFNTKIGRVSLMKNPPNAKTAYVAGWGMYNVKINVGSEYLKHIKQRVWTRKECNAILSDLPPGTLCAGEKNANQFVARGDSGSGLMIKNYIQIGLVSYKRPDVSDSLVVYTDVTYFYEWIKKNSIKLFCLKQ